MPRVMLAYFSAVRAARHVIPLLWMAVIGCGVKWGPDFFDNLQDNLNSAPDSPSNISERLFEQDGFGFADSAVAFLSYTDHVVCPAGGCDITSDPFAKAWVDSVNELGFYSFDFFNQNGTDTTLFAPYLVSEDRRALIVAFPGYYGCYYDAYNLRDQAVAANNDTERYFAGFTGRDAMDCHNSDAAKSDLGHMDAVAVPLALLVLAWRVGSMPLCLIAFLALPTGLLTALLVLGRTSFHVTYPNFSPALFVSTAVAMTFDWQLFMLSRYKEGVLAGRSNDMCVRDVVVYSGHTVVVSGITLAIAFLSLVGFPVEFLQATGKGAAITITSCMVVSISFTPAMLLLFPRFFRSELDCCRPGRCCSRCGSGAATGSPDAKRRAGAAAALTGADQSAEPLLRGGDRASAFVEGAQERSTSHHSYQSDETRVQAIADARAKQGKSVWFRLATFVAENRLKVIVGVLVLMSPLSVYSAQLRVTVDQNQLHDRTQDAYETWQRFREAMPSGITWPYALIAQPGPNATLADAADIVDRNNKLIADLVNATHIEARLFNGPTWLNGEPQDLLHALGYIGYPACTEPLCPTPLSYYSQLRNMQVPHLNPDNKAFYTEIDTPFDPQGAEVEDFVRTVRDVIAKHNNATLVTFHLALGLTTMVDVVDAVYARAPVVLLATVGVLLLVVAIAFRSIVVAIRLVFTLAVTLSWSFGSGVIVFQTALFNWTGKSMENVEALSWMAPIMTFSLILSLATDYDVFITTRIREYRSLGYSDTAAVIKGYYRTGGVITTAGMIMVISFGCLMLSSQMLLVECGFLLAFSVVLDTFIVRSLLVPAIMVAMGRLSWFPATMPPGTLGVDAVDVDVGIGGGASVSRDPGMDVEHVALGGVAPVAEKQAR